MNGKMVEKIVKHGPPARFAGRCGVYHGISAPREHDVPHTCRAHYRPEWRMMVGEWRWISKDDGSGNRKNSLGHDDEVLQ